MRTQTYDRQASKRPVNLTLNGDLLTRARAEGLNISSISEQALAAALARLDRERFDAEVAQAARVHERYLAEYGSLGDWIRANPDDAG